MNLPDGTPIEPGKHYITRGGNRVRIYAVDGDGRQPIHGAVENAHGWVIETWTNTGHYYSSSGPSQFDLIGPWIDKPVVDWSKLAAWHRFVAMDKDGEWAAYPAEPKQFSLAWVDTCNIGNTIPPDYAPKWTGDWKLSLVERPQ